MKQTQIEVLKITGAFQIPDKEGAPSIPWVRGFGGVIAIERLSPIPEEREGLIFEAERIFGQIPGVRIEIEEVWVH